MKLAVDANVLLSAVIGGRARLVLTHPEMQNLYTTDTTLVEMRGYAVSLGRKKRLTPEIVMLEIAALPVEVVDRSTYQPAMAKDSELIGWRDPGDAELLALALSPKVPIWSNDNDFENCGVERFTTAEILSKLGISEGP